MLKSNWSVVYLSLGIVLLFAIFMSLWYQQPKVEAYKAYWGTSIVSDSYTISKDPMILNVQLKELVLSKGYTWEQWLKNDIPRDVKWEITKENSKNILRYLKGDSIENTSNAGN
jgi:hypothetical protein